MENSFRVLGTILGAIILVVGLALTIYALINPAFGYTQSLFVGLTAIAFGAIVIYAARKG